MNHQPKKFNTTTQDLYKQIKKTLQKNRQLQLFYKAFLQPIQIALKTQNSMSSMPNGIKQVLKTSIGQNKYSLCNFQSLQSVMATQKSNKHDHYDIKIIKQKFCDNLISLLKPIKTDLSDTQRLKVAICVCMYSEDKAMLKRTLCGISQNIKVFQKKGITSNQIAVFVLMDGIQVVHPSVQQYFTQLQKQNNIYLGQDVDKLDPQQLIKQQRQIQDQQVSNINHLIFSDAQFQDRKNRRFSQRKKQYIMHKKMKNDIQKMQKDKSLTYDSLDATLQKFFLQKAREQWKRDYGLCDTQMADTTSQKILQWYQSNYKLSIPIIHQALSQGKKYCQQYISTRDNLALLNPFRVSIQASINMQPQKPKQSLNQEEDQVDDVKMNLFMVTKYKNRGKLSSHNWFFNGFCEELKPQYAVLLDVGLAPQRKSLWRMFNHMENNRKVGGVCGYMGLKIERVDQGEQVKDQNIDCITSLFMRLVDIQRAQQFQYHFAHLIDKPFEAWFNFIHVLPGAFSAYRMDAITKGNSKLLKQYFKSIDQASNTTFYKVDKFTPFQTICKVIFPDILYNWCYYKPPDDSYERLLYDENVYLAQDRTLCMGIYQNNFNLTYLPDATAWVDPIKTLYGLLGQRKRWINGSYFAFEKVKQALYPNSQNNGETRNGCLLQTQMIFLTLMSILGYISPALFMFTVHIAMYAFQTEVIYNILQNTSNMRDVKDWQDNPMYGIFVYVADFIYVMMFLGLVFYSMHLTNRESKFKTFFYGVSTVCGLFSLSVFGVLLYDIISGFTNKQNSFLIQNPWFVKALGVQLINSLRYIMLTIIGLYAIPVVVFFLFGRVDYVIDILFSTISFLFYSPTYHNILNIYALCRIDDISWGTKGIDATVSSHKKQIMEDWKKIKLIHVSKFVFWNSIVAFVLLLFGNDYIVRFWITFGIMVALLGSLSIKIFIGFLYLIKYRLCSTYSHRQPQQVEDKVNMYFSKVKNSLYNGIKESIAQKQKETRAAGWDEKKTTQAMKSSVIWNQFKFTKGYKNDQDKKKRKQNISRISIRIEKKELQFIGKNPIKENKNENGTRKHNHKKQKRDLQSNQNEKDTTMQEFQLQNFGKSQSPQKTPNPASKDKRDPNRNGTPHQNVTPPKNKDKNTRQQKQKNDTKQKNKSKQKNNISNGNNFLLSPSTSNNHNNLPSGQKTSKPSSNSNGTKSNSDSKLNSQQTQNFYANHGNQTPNLTQNKIPTMPNYQKPSSDAQLNPNQFTFTNHVKKNPAFKSTEKMLKR